MNSLDLEWVLEQCWSSFRAGAEGAICPWRLPIVGTGCSEGAELRTVVLREADTDSRTLTFHTDARAQKVTELEKSGRAAWLFFDPQIGVQIRAQSHVTLHHNDDLARRLWEDVPRDARGNYSSRQSPGEPLDSRIATTLCGEEAFFNFLVVQCEVVFLDWLQISNDGHQRAQFRWNGKAWNGVQVTP